MRAKLLQKYLKDEQKELQALYALQALMVQMEQPASEFLFLNTQFIHVSTHTKLKFPFVCFIFTHNFPVIFFFFLGSSCLARLGRESGFKISNKDQIVSINLLLHCVPMQVLSFEPELLYGCCSKDLTLERYSCFPLLLNSCLLQCWNYSQGQHCYMS